MANTITLKHIATIYYFSLIKYKIVQLKVDKVYSVYRVPNLERFMYIKSIYIFTNIDNSISTKYIEKIEI